MARIVIATALVSPAATPSDSLYLDALAAAGHTAAAAPWNGDQAPFAAADLVVLRATWDYHRDIAAYRAWLDALDRAGTPVANPTALVRWNLAKGYLGELGARGIPVPRQQVVARQRAAVAAAIEAVGGRAVVKPAVGASGHGVTLVEPGGLEAAWPGIEAAAAPHAVVVQEYAAAIRTHGQVSLVFFAGAFSHAVRFLPRPGEFRINSRFKPEIEDYAPAPAILAAAARVLDALPGRTLYARIDGIAEGDRFLLLEAEVHEPGLLLDRAPEAPARFAAATGQWLAG